MKVTEGLVTVERTWNTGDYESLVAGCSVWFDIGDADLSESKQAVRKFARLNVLEQRKKLDGNSQSIKATLPDGVTVKTVSVTLSRRVNLGDYEGTKVLYTDWADVEDAIKDTPRLWDSVWANLNDEVAQLKGEQSTESEFGLKEVKEVQW